MISILNKLFSILKYILLASAFCLTFYIIVAMYDRVGRDLSEALELFLPFIILFILFFINLILRQKGITKNIFYNLTCVLALSTIIFIGLRSMFDTNLIFNERFGYGINFVYFNDNIQFIKLILYGLCIGNIFLIFGYEKERKRKYKKEDMEII